MKKVQIDRPVVEWQYRSLFGKTKTTWFLAPLEMVVKDPKVQKGTARRLARRQSCRKN